MASPMSTAAGRIGGGARRWARWSQSAAQRAAKAHGALSKPLRSPSSLTDGSRTSSTERSTERSASAASIARVGAVELEGLERADEHAGVGAERLTRAGDGRRDRQSLLQRVAQRGDLAVRVETVLAGGALRLGVAETTLPGAERVGADVQNGGSFGCLQRAHGPRTAADTVPSCAGSAQLARDFRFILCISLTGLTAFISVFSADRPADVRRFDQMSTGFLVVVPPKPPK